MGQENRGSIQGKVLDTNGAAVTGAQVTVEGQNLVRALTVTTTDDGSYFFGKVPVGAYTVTVTQAGFKSSKTEEIRVQLGSETRLDFKLEVGNVSETVTVTGTTDQLIDLISHGHWRGCRLAKATSSVRRRMEGDHGPS